MAARRALLLAAAAVAWVTVSGTGVAAASTLEGIVRTLAADTVETTAVPRVFRGHSEDVYRQVVVAGNRSYFLNGRKARPNTRVRVTGTISGHDIEATSVETLATVAGVPPTGSTRVLVMLAYWTAPDHVTPATASSQMFSDSNGWYREASYSALGQTGDVTPWMPIPAPATGCYGDSGTLMSNARSAAAARGYTLSNYDNFVLYFPNCGGDAASFAGWAYVGAANTWLNGYLDRRVTVHEEGHNYGLWHSHSNLCSGGGLAGTCSFSDYGDTYDAMGSSDYVGHFNASQKSLLGWMGGRVADLSAGGSATLAPMAGASTLARGVVVRLGTGRSYWAEYRQAVGFDAGLPSSGTDGVLIHVSGSGTGSSDSGSSLIDVRPADGVSAETATLRAGQSWTSSDGVRFSVGTLSPTGAPLTVTLGYDLAVTKSGAGSGTIVSQPAGISCGATCSARFSAGTSVTLTAAAAGGSAFAGWGGGACSGTTATCTVIVNAGLSVTASFSAPSTTINDAVVGTTSGTFAYAGTWSTSTGAGKYLNDDHYSQTTGSNYTLRFSGTKVTLYGAKASHHGQASVRIDGGAAVTIDQYASTRQENVLVYQSPGLVYGAHTVSVTVAGTHQSASTGNVVAVDRAVVSTPPQATANDAVLGTTPGTFSYAGTWTTSTGVGKYLGDDHYSLTTGSNYTFRFSGTQVALYGAKASHHGQASVRIDGGAAVTIDQYASARQENVLVYQSPVLASGAHTVNVSVKGTRNSASTGYVISVDRAVSTG